jgi:Uma2 family endonuclease
MAQLARDRSTSQMRNAQPRSSYPADWYIEDDEIVPQSVEHQEHEVRLQSVLKAWNARTGRNLLVGCELAFRWDETEKGVGVDPDVFVVEMPPREANGNVYSVRTWKDRNVPPMLAIEIVSRHRPGKDYSQSPLKHDALGTFELWVFDPELHGHTKEQPSVRLQLFQRETNARLVQTYAGEGPVYSEALEAWVTVVDDQLVISSDREGKDRWPTLEETAQRRADEEAKRADEEAKRADVAEKRADVAEAEKERAVARIAELEAMLARQK